MPDDKIVGLSSPSTLKRADSSVLKHASAAQPERKTFGLEFTAMIAIVLILNCLRVTCADTVTIRKSELNASTERLGHLPGALKLKGCRSARVGQNFRIIFVIREEHRKEPECGYCFCKGLDDRTVVFSPWVLTQKRTECNKRSQRDAYSPPQTCRRTGNDRRSAA